MNTNFERGTYNEISLSQLDEESHQIIKDLVVDAGTRPDEHGSWEFRAEFDNKGRGSAINWDLYAIGNDVHDGQLLAVIQVRRYEKAHKNWWPSVRKNYFLIGRNEDGIAFSHPVESRVIHYAISKGRDVIKSVQDWMFGGDYAGMLRQGDVAFLPLSRPNAPEIGETAVVVAGNHEIVARKIRQNGNLYVQDFTASHPQHPTVAARGWYKVIESNRAKYWKFAAPTKD